ncbi:HNH endonuclease [Aeromonas sp. sia0103]|uniref:HNH endonuclease n=1 Tax=Aeromonas sp. sia0103 TaxID=2854782 RepID=UPI001C46293F|nr:HNH endonuclease [Aeromonas sp. sia0103]MBV7597897.1 HNH endonuclease [Aeromonas sp. sia0103]
MSSKKKCALCSTILIKGLEGNDSEEHIIPNSIGGRKVISGFICQPCNSKAGDHGEAELAKQLNWWSLTIGIKRQRNKPPAMNVDMVGGGKVRLKADGSIESADVKLEKTPLADGRYHLHITAPNIKRAEEMLNGLKKKHPHADLNSIRENLEHITINNPVLEVGSPFGGEGVGYSAVKSACALAAYYGLDVDSYGLSAQFLRGKITEPVYNFLYNRDVVINRPDNHLFHCVAVKSDLNKKLLLGYVEYFGFGRLVMILSDKYTGGEVSAIYAIDPVEGKEIDLDVDLILSDAEVKKIKCGEPDYDGFVSALNYALPIALKISRQRSLMLSIEQEAAMAYEKVIHELGIHPGQEMTKELAREISTKTVNNMQPFISKLFRR